MYKDNLALLAAAAYGNFTDKNNVDSIQRALLDQDILEKQATQFTDTYEILAHQANTANGYSGTIVRNKHSHQVFVLH
ncbi:hypothetical protein CFY87_08455 [Actinobacillus seminis]|uniref:Uncharacterized protein n=1 Tax=Actinobacillus seminis TaxID=722 RepID=A0A263HAL7_9PAST|nr:hypothetical protein [Actinobacillus seminis]OZN24490.1 hypothetical protein CFY87_08455 [Actinobacillus seminis]SUU38468.1 Uncharacterised protein [Actinobacillus seminis]